MYKFPFLLIFGEHGLVIMIYSVWSSWNNLYYFIERDEGREKRERDGDLPVMEGVLASAPHGGREVGVLSGWVLLVFLFLGLITTLGLGI